MYLSRLALDPRVVAVRRDLADCQGLHRTLLRGFADGIAGDGEGARAAAGLLFRVEVDRRSDTPVVLAQSELAPAWSRLPLPYLARPAETKPLDGLLAGLAPGQRLRFRLRANPTKRLKTPATPGGSDRLVGKRVELLKEEERLAWLARKGEAAGFRLGQTEPGVPAVDVRPEPVAAGQHGRERMTLGSVLFEGVLEVTDADLLRSAIRSGIGSGRAYGFGLLSVAPAR